MANGLPYARATSGKSALDEIGRVLTRFGCKRFGTMIDNDLGEVIVQFTYRGRDVSVRASVRGYAAALIRERPHTRLMRKSITDHEREALRQAQISVCSVLRDWVKGQVMAVETGMLTFEGAFLGQILLPGTGRTVLEHVQQRGDLPALESPK
jgi:hypothetical protein